MRRLLPLFLLITFGAATMSLAQKPVRSPEAVYRAYQKALQTEDWSKIKPFVAAATVTAMESLKDVPRGVKRSKAMQPQGVNVLKQEVSGDSARLEVTGTRDGELWQGSVEFAREGGAWKIVKERWLPTRMAQPPPGGAAPAH